MDNPTSARTLSDQLDQFPETAHFVLTKPNKIPINKWKDASPSRSQVIAHVQKGGLLGLIPWSIGLAVIDIDKGGRSETPGQDVEALLGPALARCKTRGGGWHLWYKPEHPCGNAPWELPNGVCGDIRCEAGYVILWDIDAPLEALEKPYSSPVDLGRVPRKTDQFKAKAKAAPPAPAQKGEGGGPMPPNGAAYPESLLQGTREGDYDLSLLSGIDPGGRHDTFVAAVAHYWSTTGPLGWNFIEPRLREAWLRATGGTRAGEFDEIVQSSQRKFAQGTDPDPASHPGRGGPPTARRRPKRAAGSEAVVPPPGPYGIEFNVRLGPYDFGEWVARALGCEAWEGPRFSFSDPTFWRSQDTHWEAIDEESVLRAMQGLFRDVLYRWASDWLSSAGKGPETTVAINTLVLLKDRLWNSKNFIQGLKATLRRDMDPSPRHRALIPMLNGMLHLAPGAAPVLSAWDWRVHTNRTVIPVSYDPTHSADEFVAIWRSWFPDPDVGQYVLDCMGEGLMGQAHRRYLVIRAESGSGKTVLFNLIDYGMGHLAYAADGTLFDSKQTLHNAPLVTVLERRPRFVILDEAQDLFVGSREINKFTGGGELSARRPNDRNYTEGTIEALPIFLGEAPPNLNKPTSGTRARQRVAEMALFEGTPDAGLLLRSMDPTDPILIAFVHAVIAGAQSVLDGVGVREPASIRDFADRALAEQDPLGAWLDECGAHGSMGDTVWNATSPRTSSQVASAYNEVSGEDWSSRRIGRVLSSLSKTIRSRILDGRTVYWPKG